MLTALPGTGATAAKGMMARRRLGLAESRGSVARSSPSFGLLRLAAYQNLKSRLAIFRTIAPG